MTLSTVHRNELSVEPRLCHLAFNISNPPPKKTCCKVWEKKQEGFYSSRLLYIIGARPLGWAPACNGYDQGGSYGGASNGNGPWSQSSPQLWHLLFSPLHSLITPPGTGLFVFHFRKCRTGPQGAVNKQIWTIATRHYVPFSRRKVGMGSCVRPSPKYHPTPYIVHILTKSSSIHIGNSVPFGTHPVCV